MFGSDVRTFIAIVLMFVCKLFGLKVRSDCDVYCSTVAHFVYDGCYWQLVLVCTSRWWDSREMRADQSVTDVLYANQRCHS